MTAGKRKVPQASPNMLVLVPVVETNPALLQLGEAACEKQARHLPDV